MFTITDLKKHLGPGLGLRKNKYLIEIPVPGIEGRTLNILCQSAGLPERNITTTSVYRYGRRYTMRGETDYIGTYDVSILDDSNMAVRSIFDKWMRTIDNTKPVNAGIAGASFEPGVADALSNISSGLEVANQIKNTIEDPLSSVDFFLGFIDKGNAASAAVYQTDVNIWQLSADNRKVYGYKLQNAFPSQVGIVTLEDAEENTLSEFSVTFSFSEFTELENRKPTAKLVRALAGDDAVDILDGIESLFD
jgi:hypothetical protein